uniref:Symplekin n=1 Tax=Timema shepardi TaxID=629360 RepID=A0A7R9B403_TIMSH|nr:unnamed protein product [Timema shepardi]
MSIVDWLNQATLATDSTKTDLLRKVQEVIINKDDSLLDNFLDEVLGFQNDRNQDVRKFIVGFIEEAIIQACIYKVLTNDCSPHRKKDPDLLPKVITNLLMLLDDQSVQVQKRVIQAATNVYRSALGWLSRARSVSEEMEAAWNVMARIKVNIVNLVDSDNDGIRTHAVKFLECVVLLQTYPTADSMRRDNDFSLEDIPLTLKIARRRKLEEEATMVFELLVKFHGSQHVSSVNLMTCMGSLTLIAKLRPQFMGRVIAAMETLHTNLPPTLSKSQVSSVRKHLKMQLLNLLKHAASIDYHNNITTLLTDLGATHQEVMKSLPKTEEVRRRQKRLAAENAVIHAVAPKRARVEIPEEVMEDDNTSTEDSMSLSSPSMILPDRTKRQTDLVIDLTEQFIVERLNPELTTQLVMMSMVSMSGDDVHARLVMTSVVFAQPKLPDTMPPHFSAMYTPIAAAGTHGQIKHVARLMATQLSAAGLGPSGRPSKKLIATTKIMNHYCLKQCKDLSRRGSFTSVLVDCETVGAPSESSRPVALKEGEVEADFWFKAKLKFQCFAQPTERTLSSRLMSSTEDEEDQVASTKSSVLNVVSGMMEDDSLATKTTLLPAGTSVKVGSAAPRNTTRIHNHELLIARLVPVKQRIKTLKLSEITRPLDVETTDRMLTGSIHRILRAEREAAFGGVSSIRHKMITTIASTFNKLVREEVLVYLLEDLKTRLDLGLAWLYEEYSYMQGFNRVPSFLKKDQSPDSGYNKLLCSLAQGLTDSKDKDFQGQRTGLTELMSCVHSLLKRLYLEAPLITEEATDLLKHMCGDDSRASMGLSLLQDLVIRRPPRQLTFLNALLEHTAHEHLEVRSKAIQCVVELYDRGDLRSIIEEYAIFYLSFLRLPQPPVLLFGPDRGRPNKSDSWSEDIVKACLYLYLALLPNNESLIHELARVYVQTVADVKRIILRLLEQPVRGMGMDSPQLLTLVEECPKGAETLVTRVIHILTEKCPPSAQLVAQVRDLYQTRVSDVRFLIPVLNGLTKKEVIAALPKLIKLNPVVVKEVFNRLLGSHSDGMLHTSPLNPAELLIALHNIDPLKCELKTIIKATSLCFLDKQAYTSTGDVLLCFSYVLLRPCVSSTNKRTQVPVMFCCVSATSLCFLDKQAYTSTATSLCFLDKQAYTQEVLAVVMQNLMEQNPLPTLLMRTVIQSLALNPRLIGFIMNILQRLILKQVWKQKKVWEGFIKCCQRTKPQSFQVLLQLPPAQLQDVFQNCPDLQQPLLAHVMGFTDNQISQSVVTNPVLLFQRAHIPQSIMDVLTGNRRSSVEEYSGSMDIMSPTELTIDMKDEGEDSTRSEPAPPGMD